MNQENAETRGRLWLRAAGLAGRRGGEPFAAPARGMGQDAAFTAPVPPPDREESRVLRVCLLALLTLLTTTLWFSVLFQNDAALSYVTDEAAIRTLAHLRFAEAARVARAEGDVATADWVESLP